MLNNAVSACEAVSYPATPSVQVLFLDGGCGFEPATLSSSLFLSSKRFVSISSAFSTNGTSLAQVEVPEFPAIPPERESDAAGQASKERIAPVGMDRIPPSIRTSSERPAVVTDNIRQWNKNK